MQQALERVLRDFRVTDNPNFRRCPHGFEHPTLELAFKYYPGYTHSCDGCYCEGERDRRDYGWPHDTTPKEEQ